MNFAFACPYCGDDLEAETSQVGRSITCRFCGESLIVPFQDGERPATPRRQKRTLRSSTLDDIRSIRHDTLLWKSATWVFLLFASIAWGFDFRGGNNPPLLFFANLGLCFLWWPLKWGPFLTWSDRTRKLTSAATLAIVFVLLNFTGKYTVVDREEDRSVVTTYYRWDRTPCYQGLYFWGEEYSGSYQGPVTDSGSKHGCWRYFDGPSSRVTDTWYWHDEEVTEAQFYQLERD